MLALSVSEQKISTALITKKKEGKKARKKSERKENIDASTARYTRENGFNEKRFVWAFYYHHLDVLYYNYR